MMVLLIGGEVKAVLEEEAILCIQLFVTTIIGIVQNTMIVLIFSVNSYCKMLTTDHLKVKLNSKTICSFSVFSNSLSSATRDHYSK